MSALLQLRDVGVRFGAVTALGGVSFEVDEGSLFGLIGPNGAGKTTLIDAVSGFLPQATGDVLFASERLNKLPAHRRAHRGLIRTFQSLELFEDLTVRENLLVAAEPQTWLTSIVDLVRPGRESPVEAVEHALEVVGLSHAATRMPSELSNGQRKLVAVARALASQARLVMLDEPAAGLDTRESRELGAHLRAVVDSGVTMLLIDHDMGLVLGICDRVHVLDFGVTIAEGTPAEIRADSRVISAYLGESDDSDGDSRALDRGESLT